ncbi:MBL fold metallo-hydrolase [Campylobacter mucosalis]|uniref:MBL fold metallo-hydrolase n=1 Tax=Campylobacter mucosalis TaxID=202 RepID=UPI00146FD3B6|nr:MBL fold metallo-hydrolase [Campylobacter mucosalis]
MKISKIAMATLMLFSVANAFEYQHIRNATAKINYAGTTFLVDPYLADKGAYKGFDGTINSDKRNPLINMTLSKDEILKGVNAVIVTHTHDDHWDEVASKFIDKNMPIFVQNAGDARIIRSQGFKDVRVMGVKTDFNGVKLSRINGGQHGTDQMYATPLFAEILGDAMGVVFSAQNEKPLYIVGDTIWVKAVENAVDEFKPSVIVLNTGYAKLEGYEGGIIMGTDDVAKMSKYAPNANLITVHMDAVNHTTISSDDMRNFVKTNKIQNVAVPKEGEILKY